MSSTHLFAALCSSSSCHVAAINRIKVNEVKKKNSKSYWSSTGSSPTFSDEIRLEFDWITHS